MPVTRFEIRSGAYYDSVVLMQLQAGLAALDGVLDAGVVMATPTNCALLAENELLPAEVRAGPDDLLIVVHGASPEAAEDALKQVDALLTRRRSSGESEFRPRSLESAVKLLPEAQWVAISVPGKYAAGVARQALRLGRHVFLYSDNVSLEEEIELKDIARSQGLLVMGPDCGTAILNGVGLGFANRVRPGGIGLVAASGTGLQAVSAQIHSLGAGISQALGTGGRDLSVEVAGRTARQCLDLLARDPHTRVIVLVSKPPDPQVAARLLAAARAVPKPVVVGLLGYPPPARRWGNLHFAISSEETAQIAVRLLAELDNNPDFLSQDGPSEAPRTASEQVYLRGLFSGGTLAAEALLALRVVLQPLYSNVYISGVQPLPDPASSLAHTIIDLGADEFTVGRLHPMMDYDLRLRRLRQEAAQPEVGAILLDVVLGEGSHPDPAAELAPVIAEICQKRNLVVAVLLIGTDEDPQDLSAQAGRLEQAGARVFQGTRAASAFLGDLLAVHPGSVGPPVALASLPVPLAVINVGLESFHHSLRAQGASSIQLDWRPPAGGDERLISILAKMKS